MDHKLLKVTGLEEGGFLLLLQEGLLSRWCMFSKYLLQVSEEHREVGMAVRSIGIAVGVTTLAFLSIIGHNQLLLNKVIPLSWHPPLDQ